jgi:hypothetical protein
MGRQAISHTFIGPIQPASSAKMYLSGPEDTLTSRPRTSSHDKPEAGRPSDRPPRLVFNGSALLWLCCCPFLFFFEFFPCLFAPLARYRQTLGGVCQLLRPGVLGRDPANNPS